MEPENHQCSKENDLPNLHYVLLTMFHVDFQGCILPKVHIPSFSLSKKNQPFLWLQPVCRFSTSSLRPSTNSSPRIWAGPIHNYLLLASRDSWRVDVCYWMVWMVVLHIYLVGLIGWFVFGLCWSSFFFATLRVCQLSRAGGAGGGFCCCCCRQYSCSHCFGLNITRLIPYFPCPLCLSPSHY